MEIEQFSQIDGAKERHIEEDIGKVKEIVRRIHADPEAMAQAHELAISD